MDKRKPITLLPALRLTEEQAPYWNSPHSSPGALEILTELGSREAWRIAMTIPDLVAAGRGEHVAKMCVRWVEHVARGVEAGEGRELEIAIGLAEDAIDGSVNADSCTAAGGRWKLTLSSELLAMVHTALTAGKDRGAVFEAFGYFAGALLTESAPKRVELLDAMLFDVSRFIRSAHQDPIAFRGGDDVYASSEAQS